MRMFQWNLFFERNPFFRREMKWTRRLLNGGRKWLRIRTGCHGSIHLASRPNKYKAAATTCFARPVPVISFHPGNFVSNCGSNFRAEVTLSVVSSSSQTRFVQDRIATVEKHFAEICTAMAAYARKIAGWVLSISSIFPWRKFGSRLLKR